MACWLVGGSSYEIPPDIRNLLDQLKAQAEALGLPQEGKDVSEEPSTQGGEEKAPKKLPPQLNPLLAKLARAAARENDIQSGAALLQIATMQRYEGMLSTAPIRRR